MENGVALPVVKKKNKGLIVVLCLLFLAIVGLVIGLIINFINKNNEYKDEEAIVDVMNDVKIAYDSDGIVDEISKKMSAGEYTLDEAEAEIKMKMNELDDDGKVYLVKSWAGYLWRTYADVDLTVGVLKDAEKWVSDDMKEGYYIFYRKIYQQAGMSEQVEYYNNLILEMAQNEE